MIEVARILLALVFVVAGVAKLLDLGGSRQAIAGFGVPAALARPLGLALPLTELAIAVTLVPASTSRYAAIAAAVMLAVFSAVIAIALARSRKPDCHCFGRLHSAPAGLGTLGRNLTLAGLATAVALAPAVTPTWPQVAVAALVVAAGAQALLWVALLRRYGLALRRIDALENTDAATELELGEAAPPFSLPDLDGRLVSSRTLLARRRPVLLIFVDAGCAPCRALLPRLAEWQQDVADRLTIAVVGGGNVATLRSAVDHLPLELLVSADGAVADDYAVDGTPSAVLVGADGKIASTLQYGAESIKDAVQNGARFGQGRHDTTSHHTTRSAWTNGLEVSHAR